jgi:hypothetical protein
MLPDVVSKASHDARIGRASPVCPSALGDGPGFIDDKTDGPVQSETKSHRSGEGFLGFLDFSAPGIDAGRRTLESLCAPSKTTGRRRKTAKTSTCQG